MGKNIRRNNKSRKEAKQRNRNNRQRENHAKLNREALGITNCSITWHRVRYRPISLYPTILFVDEKPTRGPTDTELKAAQDEVKTFRLIKTGLNVIRDPMDKNSVIAIIEFTRFEDLTDTEKDDLNFVSTFLHQSKNWISAVRSSSRIWGGLMWAIGWRKSSDTNQIAGRYIKAFNESHMFAYDFHYKKSARLGNIIGNLFKKWRTFPSKKIKT